MEELVRNLGCRRWLAPFALALVAAALVPPPARAAFPGPPGPIAYPRLVPSETSADTGGLFAHGPRRGHSRRQLTSNPDDGEPSYSPNGRLIVFVGDRGSTPVSDAASGSHIYLMRADGSGARQLTGGDNLDSSPSFSPDGRRIVFDRGVGSSRFSHIFTVRLDGRGLRQLTHGPGRDRDPVFTPDGRRVVFVSNRDRDTPTDRTDIFAMRRDGAHLRVLVDGRRNDFDPDVSPDGRRLAFVSNRAQGPNIFVSRIDGRRMRRITHSHGSCLLGGCYTSPSWAPNGRHIAYLRIGPRSSDLEVMRPNGSHPQQLDMAASEAGGFGTSIDAPAWGPRPR